MNGCVCDCGASHLFLFCFVRDFTSKMGNTPATGRKRSRSAARKSSPSQPEQKKVRNRSKKRDSDEQPADNEVECLSPALTPAPNSRKKEKEKDVDTTLKWKPAAGATKLTQSAGKPAASASASTSASSSTAQRNDRKKEPALIPATTGPRCRKGDSGQMFQVEAVIKKWVGPSDRSDKDVFYLIHFAGQNRPPLKNADESLWQHPTQMAGCKSLIEELERSSSSKRKESSRRPVFFYETDESEADEKPVDQRLVFESSEVNGRTLRKRQDNGTAVAGDVQAASKRNKRSRTSSAAAAIGFDRNLPPESIVGSTHYKQQLLYAVKWKGCNKVDFVVSTLCHEKAPGLVVDYLLTMIQNVPSISSDELDFPLNE